MPAFNKTWSNDIAFWEGWGVFTLNGDPAKPVIQRLDDPQSIHVSYAGVPTFNSDAEAFNHVRKQAMLGSSYHTKALNIVNLKEQSR